MITAATSADQYWHLQRSECRNAMIYAHTVSRALATCDVIVGSLMLLASEAGDFVEFILLYFHILSDFPFILHRIPRCCAAVV